MVKENLAINIEGQKKWKTELRMFHTTKANTEKILKSAHKHMK